MAKHASSNRDIGLRPSYRFNDGCIVDAGEQAQNLNALKYIVALLLLCSLQVCV